MCIGDADYPYVVFDFTADHTADGPTQFLAGYKGYFQADALAQYEGLYGEDKVKHVCCSASRPPQVRGRQRRPATSGPTKASGDVRPAVRDRAEACRRCCRLRSTIYRLKVVCAILVGGNHHPSPLSSVGFGCSPWFRPL